VDQLSHCLSDHSHSFRQRRLPRLIKRHSVKVLGPTLNEIAEEANENAKCFRRRVIHAAT
jgi:hypothetical protein